MFNLGHTYKKGNTEQGVPDNEKALRWYTKAVEADPTYVRAKEEVEALTQLMHLGQTDYRCGTNPFGK